MLVSIYQVDENNLNHKKTATAAKLTASCSDLQIAKSLSRLGGSQSELLGRASSSALSANSRFMRSMSLSSISTRVLEEEEIATEVEEVKVKERRQKRKPNAAKSLFNAIKHKNTISKRKKQKSKTNAWKYGCLNEIRNNEPCKNENHSIQLNFYCFMAAAEPQSPPKANRRYFINVEHCNYEVQQQQKAAAGFYEMFPIRQTAHGVFLHTSLKVYLDSKDANQYRKQLTMLYRYAFTVDNQGIVYENLKPESYRLFVLEMKGVEHVNGLEHYEATRLTVASRELKLKLIVADLTDELMHTILFDLSKTKLLNGFNSVLKCLKQIFHTRVSLNTIDHEVYTYLVTKISEAHTQDPVSKCAECEGLFRYIVCLTCMLDSSQDLIDYLKASSCSTLLSKFSLKECLTEFKQIIYDNHKNNEALIKNVELVYLFAETYKSLSSSPQSLHLLQLFIWILFRDDFNEDDCDINGYKLNQLFENDFRTFTLDLCGYLSMTPNLIGSLKEMTEPSQCLLAVCFDYIFSKNSQNYEWNDEFMLELNGLFSINILVWYYYQAFKRYLSDGNVSLDEKWSQKLTCVFSTLLQVSLEDTLSPNPKHFINTELLTKCCYYILNDLPFIAKMHSSQDPSATSPGLMLIVLNLFKLCIFLCENDLENFTKYMSIRRLMKCCKTWIELRYACTREEHAYEIDIWKELSNLSLRHSKKVYKELITFTDKYGTEDVDPEDVYDQTARLNQLNL